jgi:hypothetical protein
MNLPIEWVIMRRDDAVKLTEEQESRIRRWLGSLVGSRPGEITCPRVLSENTHPADTKALPINAGGVTEEGVVWVEGWDRRIYSV